MNGNNEEAASSTEYDRKDSKENTTKKRPGAVELERLREAKEAKRERG